MASSGSSGSGEDTSAWMLISTDRTVIDAALKKRHKGIKYDQGRKDNRKKEDPLTKDIFFSQFDHLITSQLSIYPILV